MSYWINLSLLSIMCGLIVGVTRYPLFYFFDKKPSHSLPKFIVYAMSVSFLTFLVLTFVNGRMDFFNNLFVYFGDDVKKTKYTSVFHISPNLKTFEEILFVRDTVINTDTLCVATIEISTFPKVLDSSKMPTEFGIQFESISRTPYNPVKYLVDSIKVQYGIENYEQWLKIDSNVTEYYRTVLNVPKWIKFKAISIPEEVSIVNVYFEAHPNWLDKKLDSTIPVSVTMYKYFDSANEITFPDYLK